MLVCTAAEAIEVLAQISDSLEDSYGCAVDLTSSQGIQSVTEPGELAVLPIRETYHTSHNQVVAQFTARAVDFQARCSFYHITGCTIPEQVAIERELLVFYSGQYDSCPKLAAFLSSL